MDNRKYITRFNQFAASGQNLLTKALTSATGVGEALIPENLEQIITDTIIRLSPELAMIDALDTGGAKVHEFNRLTARPSAGGAMGESATTPVTQSASSRVTVTLKIVRRKGQVTDFLKDTSRKYIDAAAFEMQNHLQSHVLDLIYYNLYGNALVKSYVNAVEEQTPAVEFNGLDRLIVTNRINEARGGVVPTTLSDLDDMVDANIRAGGNPHKKVIEMSPELLSLFSRLETTVRKTAELKGNAFGFIDVPGGWRLATYRGIPIVETTSTSPIETMIPTVTLAQESTGAGGLSDDTYYVQVAPITLEGEQLASTEQSVVVNAGGATQRIRISLDTYHTGALAYKIYMSAATVTETLKKIVPAVVYDSNFAPTTPSTPTNGTGTNYIWIDSLTADTSVPVAARVDVPLVAIGGVAPEIMCLWDLDHIQGLGKLVYTNTAGSAFNGLVTTEPLAKTDDFLQFLTKTYAALADSFEATSVWHRGLRIT